MNIILINEIPTNLVASPSTQVEIYGPINNKRKVVEKDIKGY